MADVLVIDDEEPIRRLVRIVLETEGHQVREARDGAAGLAAYRDRPADLVLCDLFMPGKGGLETLRALRDADAGVCVVCMSGGGLAAVPNMLQVAIRLGAAGVLDKPFGAAALLGKVRRALGRAATPVAG
jgi:DNA-binding NtrC family response regulator